MNRTLVGVAFFVLALPSIAQQITAEQALARARAELEPFPPAQDSRIVSSTAELRVGPDLDVGRVFHVTPEQMAKWRELFKDREYWKVSFLMARREDAKLTWRISYYIDSRTGEAIPRLPGA